MKSNDITKYITSFIIIIIIILIFSQGSCSNPVEPVNNNDTVKAEVSNGILPLKVGYYWKYKNYNLREDSSIAGEGIDDEYKITKYSKITLGDTNYVVFHSIYGYLDSTGYIFDSDEWYLKNFHDGLYLMGGNYEADSIYAKLIWYKYPVKKGESWQSPHLVYNLIQNKYLIEDTVSYTCIDTSAIFNTPLGNFKCVVYYHRWVDNEGDAMSIWDIYDYYSYNMGLVGELTYEPDPTTQKDIPLYKKVLTQTNVNN